MKFIEPMDPTKHEVIWQIGSFDGVDNIGNLIRDYPNWSFHLFEPNPEPFRLLFKKHMNRANVSVYKLAVTDSEQQIVDFYVPTILDDPEKDWAPKVSGLTPDVLNFHALGPRKITVSAIHFRKIARLTSSIPTLLMTDTEGNDQKFVNLVRNHKPKSYVFENSHMSKNILKAHRDKLLEWGYIFQKDDGLDEVWFRSDVK